MADYATPKGMRDFLPAQMKMRETVVQTIKETFRLYGYLPFDTPAIEKLEVLQRKGGEEIEGQIFRIEGDLGLRFDLTVPLARVCGTGQFALPFKRYAVGPVWRREEPQKGRFREFYQADVDIVGSEKPECEAELLACSNECIVKLGFTNPKIKINSRKVLDALCAKIGIDDKKKNSLMRALDKIGKLSEDGIRKEMIGKGISEKQVEDVFEFIRAKGGNAKILKEIEKLDLQAAKELESILKICRGYGISPEIDLSLVRGLAYYTGTIFEIELPGGAGSVAGGGRYDGLSGLFGRKLPAVGISLGIERLITLIEAQSKGGDKGSGKESGTYSKVYVASVKEEFSSYAREVAGKFRRLGIPCETDCMQRNLGRQIESAGKSGIPFAAIVGEKEKKEGKVTLRDLVTGKESMVNVEEAVKIVLKG